MRKSAHERGGFFRLVGVFWQRRQWGAICTADPKKHRPDRANNQYLRVAGQRGEEEALKAVGLMTTGNVVDLNQEIAILAAVISMEYKLPMADSLILASARTYHAVLWTQDEHFKGLDGVNYFEKP
jgi:predicted nucleic acid-binding protein